MAEDAKNKSESQEENQSEKVDNRLPYQPPTLRKHGKVSNITQTILVPGDFDIFIGLPFSNDVS